MFKFLLLLPPLALMNGCAADESITGFVDPSAQYHLVEIDGAPLGANATIAFPSAGDVVGQAPCNRYFATQTKPYPWFALNGIGATRMACPDLDAETAYFAALEAMTLAEVSGGTLILSNTDGRSMVFEAR